LSARTYAIVPVSDSRPTHAGSESENTVRARESVRGRDRKVTPTQTHDTGITIRARAHRCANEEGVFRVSGSAENTRRLRAALIDVRVLLAL
jgi:hypothetical protein